LGKFKEFIDRLIPLLSESLAMDPPAIAVGGYGVDILTSEGLVGGDEEVANAANRLNAAAAALDANVSTSPPKSAAGCGVSSSEVAALEAALFLEEEGHPVEFLFSDGTMIVVHAPTRDAFTALAAGPKKIRKVHGEVTGLERGTDDRTMVRVGGGAPIATPALGLDEAYELVLNRIYIAGTAHWEDGSYVLWEIDYPQQSQGSLWD